MSEFKAFPKIPRGSKGETITITEKLDGTNACIIVEAHPLDIGVYAVRGVQSRKRMITPEDDNYGFAGWVESNKDHLAHMLGEGYHYGEWYGHGIHKNPHKAIGKRLALFNSERWQDGRQPRPDGVECVPILYQGEYEPDVIEQCMDLLKLDSLANGYVPEGVVVWYHKTRRYEKHTYANSLGKWVKS